MTGTKTKPRKTTTTYSFADNGRAAAIALGFFVLLAVPFVFRFRSGIENVVGGISGVMIDVAGWTW